MKTDENDLLAGADSLSENVQNLQTITIPVIEENINITKSKIEAGKIRISKKVHEQTHSVNTSLEHEEIEIETVFINQFIDASPAPVRYEGDVMIIPVLKEVAVIRLMLEKEIRVTKKKLQTTDDQNIVLRNEEVIIENILPDQDKSP